MSSPKSSPVADAPALIGTAHRIAKRVASQAIWKANECTWAVAPTDTTSKNLDYRTAGPGLYNGTAGIALFLTECGRVTGDPHLLDTARGAIQYASRLCPTLPAVTRYSLFNGAPGVALAAAAFARATQDERMADLAVNCALVIAEHELAIFTADLAGGVAGALAGLLAAADRLDADRVREVGVRLGERLIRLALLEPIGWAWDRRPFHARPLTGLAHGAAGVGFALLELFRFTGESRFRFAAEAAFEYEQRFYLEPPSNWLDLRNGELGVAMIDPSVDLRARARDLSPYRRRFARFWCHGAPGIALTRLRAFEILQDNRYATQAADALRGTKQAALHLTAASDFSLCHGAAGLCEVLMAGADILGDEEARAIAASLSDAGATDNERDGKRWTCGVLDQLLDPTLMVGEAGIGYHYLRRGAADVPSIVLPVSRLREVDKPLGPGADTVSPLRDAYVRAYFSRSIRALAVGFGDAHEATRRAVAVAQREAEPGKEIVVVERAFDDALQRYPDAPELWAVRDAFALERRRWRASLSAEFYCDETLRLAIADRSADEGDMNLQRVAVSERVEVLQTSFAWDGQDGIPANAEPQAGEGVHYYVLYTRAGAAHLAPLSRLASAVMAAVTRGSSTLSEILGDLALAPASGDRSEFQRIVAAQMRECINAGFLTTVADTTSLRSDARSPGERSSVELA